MARKSAFSGSDILLEDFVENTLGVVDHATGHWTEGTADPHREEYAVFQRRAESDYFRGVTTHDKDVELFAIATGSNVVPFPETNRSPLPLSA